MKNKLYKVSVPVTVWVEAPVRATSSKEAMIEAEDMEYELLQLGEHALDTGDPRFSICSVEDPDYDKMEVVPLEEYYTLTNS